MAFVHLLFLNKVHIVCPVSSILFNTKNVLHLSTLIIKPANNNNNNNNNNKNKNNNNNINNNNKAKGPKYVANKYHFKTTWDNLISGISLLATTHYSYLLV